MIINLKQWVWILVMMALLLSGCGAKQESKDTVERELKTTVKIERESTPKETKEKGTKKVGKQQEKSTEMIQNSTVDKIMKEMTLHEKVCQMFIVTPEGLTGVSSVNEAGETTKEALRRNPVGGLIYMENNLISKQQTERMISNTQDYAKELFGIPLFISVDEEGGNVARCGKKLGTTSLNPMYQYKNQGKQVARKNAKTIAEDIETLGFNLDFAPVADTWSNSQNMVIGTRAYSDDFSETAELVEEAVKGFHQGGVLCTLKHFPGHGDTATDSHNGMASSDKTIKQLEKQEYLSFEKGIAAGADMVMVGHITMSQIDGKPATVSRKIVTEELREKLGFQGVIITDAMNMGAITQYYSNVKGTLEAIKAGNDIVLMPLNLDAAIQGVENAVQSGEISEKRIDESIERILELKVQAGLLK